jgi:chromate reductase, NAD(P)H dehydrogenase (quinone)
VHILALSGSLRAASYNTALLREAAEVAPDGVTLDLYDGLGRLPHYNEDHDIETPSSEVARLRAAVAGADAVLIATPEFNGSMPGHLKAAVDWASRPYGPASSLWGKPVLVVGASVTDYGAIWAQDHLRKSLGIAGARVLEGELSVAKAQDKFHPEGRLVDHATREQLAGLVDTLVHTVQAPAQAA